MFKEFNSDFFFIFCSIECLVTIQNVSFQAVEHVDVEIICKTDEEGKAHRLDFSTLGANLDIVNNFFILQDQR